MGVFDPLTGNKPCFFFFLGPQFSCGYRMLHNINKIYNQENIESIANEEAALEGYTLEIVKMLKGKQQGTTRGEEERRGKRASEEKEFERKTRGKRETGAEKKGTRDATKTIKKREEIERKKKKEKKEKKESKRKKKQKKVAEAENEDRRQLKRTRQQQKQENAEGEQECSRLRSGKIRKITPVELSLSSRCRDAPD